MQSVCWFWQRSAVCPRGHSCRFAHPERNAAHNIEEAAAFTTKHQVLGSTIITVGAGLHIRHVVCGFESCRVTVKNLPSDAKEHEIVELFTQQGIHPSTFLVHQVRSHGHHREAIVLMNKEQGAPIALGLDGVEFRDESLTFEFGDNTASVAMGHSAARDSHILSVMWKAPSATMIATYTNMDTARHKARTLNNTLCAGRKVRVEMNAPPSGPALRYYHPASIKIMNLAVDTALHQVAEFAGTLVIKALKPWAYDLPSLLSALRRHLRSSGGFQNVEINQQDDGSITAKAHFEDWEHANTARERLDGVRLQPDFPLFRLFLPKPHQYVITIPPEQYYAQKRNWDSLSQSNIDKGTPQVRVSENKNINRVYIRVVGDDKKAVGALKVRVESLMAGERLDSNLWHRSLASDKKGREFLARVHDDTGVYIRSDWKIRAFRMYGDDKSKRMARQMITDYIEDLKALEWTVPVKGQAIRYLVRKGLATLKARLGDDAVALDVASRPAKLTLRGGEEARHALNDVLEEALRDPGFSTAPRHTTEGNDSCPSCYCEATQPIKLGCKHSYCTECIQHYLTSAVESKVFPLACMGDEARCQVPIPIPTIQRFLTPPQYVNLVEAAFSTYLDHHSKEFRYCTTPECSQIYRCDAKGMLQCPSCFAEVCPSCHEEGHEGLTCQERAQHKAEQEEALNNNWATANGVKKCPSCRVWIEKTEGCNHVSCRCGAHICWKCTQVFPVGEIYQHLAVAHGGAFDEDAERQNHDLVYAARLQRQYNHAVDLAQVPGQRAGIVRREREDGELEARRQAELRARRLIEQHRAHQMQVQAEQARERAEREQERQTWARWAAGQAENRARQQDEGWGCVVM